MELYERRRAQRRPLFTHTLHQFCPLLISERLGTSSVQVFAHDSSLIPEFWKFNPPPKLLFFCFLPVSRIENLTPFSTSEFRIYNLCISVMSHSVVLYIPPLFIWSKRNWACVRRTRAEFLFKMIWNSYVLLRKHAKLLIMTVNLTVLLMQLLSHLWAEANGGAKTRRQQKFCSCQTGGVWRKVPSPGHVLSRWNKLYSYVENKFVIIHHHASSECSNY